MLRKRFQKNFTTFDNRITQYEGLSFDARGVYFYMASLPDDWEFSIERIAKNGGIGYDKAKRIIDELLNIGLLKRVIYNNEKGHRKAHYDIFDFDTIINPYKENPRKENTFKENPCINKEINNNSFDKELLNKEIKETKEDFSNEKSPPYIPPLVDNQKIAMEKPTLQTASKDKAKTADALLAKKPKTKKELLDYAIAIYNQAKENNPNLALTFKAWSDWVEYKLLKEAKITYKTFELNLKKLVEYGDDANKIIEQSIGNNWSGLFDLRKFDKKSDVDIYSQMVNDLSDKPDGWREFEEYQL